VVTCAKAAELIEMLFGLWARMEGGPKESCIRWGPDSPSVCHLQRWWVLRSRGQGKI